MKLKIPLITIVTNIDLVRYDNYLYIDNGTWYLNYKIVISQFQTNIIVPIELKRQETDGAKSVRFCESPTKKHNSPEAFSSPPKVLIRQCTDSTDSSSGPPSILTSHKRSNTIQPRRAQQSGKKSDTWIGQWKNKKTKQQNDSNSFSNFFLQDFQSLETYLHFYPTKTMKRRMKITTKL